MLYEISNPSDPVTIESDDDKVAAVAVLLLGNGKFGLDDENGKNVLPILMLATEAQTNEWMKEWLGFELSGLNDFVEANLGKLADVFASALVGKMSDRKSILKAVEAGGGDTAKAQAAWNDERRSSLNDICGSCRSYADFFRNKLKAKDSALDAAKSGVLG